MKKDSGKKRIVLNYLPPGYLTKPSAGFSILKSFMENNNYVVFIKYWAFEIEKIISEKYYDFDNISDKELARLIPFIGALVIENGDVLSMNKIKVLIQLNNHNLKKNIH